jgi:hypothetical protein
MHIQINGQDVLGQVGTIQRDLSRDMFVAVDRRGRILSVRFDSNVSPAAQDVARALLGILQVVLPASEKARSQTWNAVEDDPSGSYLARYELVPSTGCETLADATCLHFRKSKGSYFPLVAREEEGRPLRTTEPHTDIFGCFDAGNGRLISLRGKETLTTVMSGHTVARSQTSIVLAFEGQQMLGELQLEALRNTNNASANVPAMALSAMPSETEIKMATRRNTLGEDTLNSLMTELARLELANERQDTSLYLRFRALAYLQPESCGPLAQRLVTADARSLTFRVLVDALSAVGSPEAQAALVAVIESRPKEWPALALLIPPLGLVSDPIPEAENALCSLAFNVSDSKIASTAQLALGNMAHRLKASFPARAERIPLESLQGSAEVY